MRGNDPAAVRRSYDAVAEDYATNLGDELDGKPLDRWLLERVVALADGGPIIEGGCGPGHVAGFLASVDPTADLSGFDLSPAMVALAQRREPGISFQVGDLFDPPRHPDGGGWAAIVSFYSIVHFVPEQLPAVFAAFLDRLRPGGRLLLACHIGAREDGVRRNEWWGHEVDLDFVFHDRDHIVASLAGAGFSVDEVIVRSPYAGAEHPTERIYVLASRPAT
jgi:SAM-dependent methyltransferase